MQVLSTTNYRLLKLISSNREVDPRHVKKLVTSIREKNLLSLNPVIVNSKMEVLDGQHRLEAAKILKVPIFYTIGELVSHDDIAKLNTNKKNWKLLDYINYFTIKGVKEFRELSKLINEFPDLPVTFLIAVINEDGSRQQRNIAQGVLDIGNLASAREIIRQVGDFPKYFDHSNSSRFLEAFVFIHKTGLYDHDFMLKKLESNPGILKACANKKGYIRLLQEVYNKGTHEKNIVLFTKRI